MSENRDKEVSQEKFNRFGEGKSCEGCMFAYGDTPMDDAPDKCSCSIYAYPKTKPDHVFLEGGKCKYYRERV